MSVSHRHLLAAAALAVVTGLVSIVPAMAQRGPTTGPAINVADYKGATTTNVYNPLPSVNAEGTTVKHDPISVAPISDELRQQFRINPFYKKTLTIRGVPVIGSEKVSDYAFLECAYLIDHMLKDSPFWVTDSLVKGHVKIGIISVVEYTMDIPENQNRRNNDPAQAAFQDRRSRGLGGRNLATCAEENLLNLNTDPYRNENITLHEFSHTVASNISVTNPDWGQRWQAAYRTAMDNHLYDGNYAGTDAQEYWAEGAQSWFDCARKEPKSRQAVHGGVWQRSEMKEYDPPGAALLKEVYGDGEWRYVKSTNIPVVASDKTYTRSPEDLTHLAGLNRAEMPAFSFNNSPRIQADPNHGRGNGAGGPPGTGRGQGRRGTTTAPATQPAATTAP